MKDQPKGTIALRYCGKCKETVEANGKHLCKEKTMKKSQPQINCTSIDCPERKSVCCGARSRLVELGEKAGYFICSYCRKDFVGGKCDAQERREEMKKDQPKCTCGYGKDHSLKGKTFLECKCLCHTPDQAHWEHYCCGTEHRFKTQDQLKCTCTAMDEDTIAEIGHFLSCPMGNLRNQKSEGKWINQEEKTEWWEKKFEEIFVKKEGEFVRRIDQDADTPEEIKSFIRTLLSKRMYRRNEDGSMDLVECENCFREREKAIRECIELAINHFAELHGGGNARRLAIQFTGKLQDLLGKKE